MNYELTQINLLTVLAYLRTQADEADSAQTDELYVSLEQIENALADPEQHDPHMRALAAACELSPFDQLLIWIAVAPNFDRNFANGYAALAGRDFPGVTPDIICAIVQELDIPAVEYVRALAADRPLHKFNIFKTNPVAAQDAGGAFYDASLIVDPRILLFLSGSDTYCEPVFQNLRPYAGDPEIDFNTLHLPEHTREQLRAISATFASAGPTRAIVQLYGPAGCGKKRAAFQLCRATNRPLLVIDSAQLLREVEARKLSEVRALLRDIVRETRLAEAGLLVPDWHLFRDKPIAQFLLLDEFPLIPGPVFLTAQSACEIPVTPELTFFSVAMPVPDAVARRVVWERAFEPALSPAARASLDFLASGFRFSERQIQRAAGRARTRSLTFGDGQLTHRDLLEACYEESNHNLNQLAVRVTGRPGRGEIILRPEPLRQLSELCDQAKFASTVYGAWGFSPGSAAHGLHALFVGPPGTGKTMAASVIAGDLGLQLYRIDLASIVSKYIGETEKNLARIFEEAETSNAILFFDEADSLFGKRGEVKDAQDRYANMEVSYLLQKMDDFPGITILATNFRANLDKAFVRRLHFIIDFPFPDAEERRKIWELNFPKTAPLASDLDLDFLATRLDVPGALIRNIARNAAFLAAAEQSAIQMKHVRRAAAREYKKDNRPVPDFAVDAQ